MMVCDDHDDHRDGDDGLLQTMIMRSTELVNVVIMIGESPFAMMMALVMAVMDDDAISL